jgi:hypothetical protein
MTRYHWILPLIFLPWILAGATEPGAASIEESLRAQGLSPGKTPPADQGTWALEVRGTATNPQFTETVCYQFTEGRTTFSGRRYVYEARNRGEWGGELTVRRGSGSSRTLIRENIFDIHPYGNRLYVFTGLDHGSMDHGAVYEIEDFDKRPRVRFITLLPGTPRAVGLDAEGRGFLVVTRLSLTLVRTSSDTIDVFMARHAALPDSNSLLQVSKSEILIGICGGVAQVHLPWRSRPPDPEYNIPIVTYWTRQ